MDRNIVSVEEVDEEEWGGEVECMDEKCTKPSVNEVRAKYPGDDRVYFTCLCDDHTGEYAISWEDEN